MFREETIAEKFGVYTLACSELISQLPALDLATVNDTKLLREDCIKRFDDTLDRFFNLSYESEITKAAERFSDRLKNEANEIEILNESASRVLNQVATTIRERASTWSFLTNIDSLHAIGREYAKRFFRDSPFEITQDKLNQICNFRFEYDSFSNSEFGNCIKPFGHKKSLMAHYHKYKDPIDEQSFNNIIIGRFALDHSFANYLSYPFLFLHEYTAHVYTADFQNERFNDGWMLHSAASFLKNTWIKSEETQTSLSRDQASVFEDFLVNSLNQLPRKAYNFAKDFESFIGNEKFKQITYELASFQPENKQNEIWPTKFINALELEFSRDPQSRQRLIKKVNSTNSIQELMPFLEPV